jgi:hypothetical protein
MFKKFFRGFENFLSGKKSSSVPTSKGFSKRNYESLLQRSQTLLSDQNLVQTDPGEFLKEENNFSKKIDPKKAKTLLEAIRARQGEVSARKGLTQTKTSLLG